MNSQAALMRVLVILGIMGLLFLAGCVEGTSRSLNNQPPPAAPTITTISPNTTVAGGFTLTINGTNFVATSMVIFGGATRTTTFVSAAQLTAAIPAAAIASAGTAAVTVTNPAPGGGASNAVNFTITSGTNSFSVAVAPDPTNQFVKFAYVANSNSNNVSMYTINPTTGALEPIGTVSAGTSPVSVAVDPSGKFVYVANKGSNNISVYTINPTTGTLLPMGTVVAGTSPTSVAVAPSGKFAYAANWGSMDISMYTINVTTGTLTPTGTIAAGGHAYLGGRASIQQVRLFGERLS